MDKPSRLFLKSRFPPQLIYGVPFLQDLVLDCLNCGCNSRSLLLIRMLKRGWIDSVMSISRVWRLHKRCIDALRVSSLNFLVKYLCSYARDSKIAARIGFVWSKIIKIDSQRICSPISTENAHVLSLRNNTAASCCFLVLAAAK